MPKKILKKSKRKTQKSAVRRKRKLNKNNGKSIVEYKALPLQFKGIKIKIIGIGGGGSSIISEIAPKLRKIKFIAANTDWQALKSLAKEAERFQFGQNLTQGLGTGMNLQLGEEAAIADKEKIKKIFEGTDLSILVSTLGGGAGSGASPVFAKIARDLKSLTFGIFTFPFEFEGSKRKDIANTSLEKLKPELNAFSLILNDKIFQIIDQKTPLKEALSAMNKVLTENLEGLIEMIHSPGLINIDFADLKAALEGRGRLTYLATVEGEGGNRTEDVLKNLLSSPVYNYGITGAERIIFNISGPKDLSIAEVQNISKRISDFNPKAKIIFGLSQKDNYKDKIRITLLAVGCDKKSALGRAKKIKESKPVKRKKIKSARPKTEPKETNEKKTSRNNHKEQIEGKKINIKISKTAMDLKKELDNTEKEMLSKENTWDAPAFLRKKT